MRKNCFIKLNRETLDLIRDQGDKFQEEKKAEFSEYYQDLEKNYQFLEKNENFD